MPALAHEVPGRLRLVDPLLKTHPERAATLAQEVKRLPGVTRVEVNSLTGSLIVFYEGPSGNRDAILRAICDPHPLYPGSAGTSPGLNPIIGAVLENLLTRAAQAMVSAVI